MYKIAREMEKEAMCISTSDEGQLKKLSQPAENLQKRRIKRALFHDELNDSSDDGNLHF